MENHKDGWPCLEKLSVCLFQQQRLAICVSIAAKESQEKGSVIR